MKVEIWENGKWLYRGLVDDGSEVMRFTSGLGFITKSQCTQNNWLIVKKGK